MQWLVQVVVDEEGRVARKASVVLQQPHARRRGAVRVQLLEDTGARDAHDGDCLPGSATAAQCERLVGEELREGLGVPELRHAEVLVEVLVALLSLDGLLVLREGCTRFRRQHGEDGGLA